MSESSRGELLPVDVTGVTMLTATGMVVTIVAGASVVLWVESFLRLWVGERYYPGAPAMLMIMLMVLQFALIRTDANIIDLTLNLRRKVLLGTVSAALSVGRGSSSRSDMGIVGLASGSSSSAMQSTPTADDGPRAGDPAARAGGRSCAQAATASLFVGARPAPHPRRAPGSHSSWRERVRRAPSACCYVPRPGPCVWKRLLVASS
jgi:hypothetical protein